MTPVGYRNWAGAAWGMAIGALGGLIGLGGAEFRLPVLAGRFGMRTLDAIVFNKAISLIVVGFAIGLRSARIPATDVLAHWAVAVNLLAGSLIGAWWAAGHALRLSGSWLDRTVLALLMGLGLLMLIEPWLGAWLGPGQPMLEPGVLRAAVGVIAGLLVGTIAALLGVAGGELLIPIIVLLFGLDIKLAGSLSLCVSLPTMLAGFARYRDSEAFAVLQRERGLLLWTGAGSVAGVGLGAFGLRHGGCPDSHHTAGWATAGIGGQGLPEADARIALWRAGTRAKPPRDGSPHESPHRCRSVWSSARLVGCCQRHGRCGGHQDRSGQCSRFMRVPWVIEANLA